MALRVKLDEHLSDFVGDPMREAGYVVASVAGQGWRGLKDPEVWPRIGEEGVFFITADKGFADIRAYPPGSHPGILVLRPDRESVLNYREPVAGVIRTHRLESLSGYITVATPRGVRVRRTPPAGTAE
jgi:predicted nuclease of predicted toxin-antitoxin system